MSDLSSVSGGGGTSSKMEYHSLDFKIRIDCVKSGQETYVHLVAPTKQDKAAWITDISQVNFIKPDNCIVSRFLPFEMLDKRLFQ